MTKLKFGDALELLKQGKKVCREGWNGKNMYLKLIQGYPVNGHLNAANPYEKLPAENPDGTPNVTQGNGGQMLPYIVLKTAGNSVNWGEGYSDYVAWNPNNLDMLAEDWK